MSFKEITIKQIGSMTSFSRTSIYNYFQTKEEIFLALLEREYETWTGQLEKIRSENESLSKEDFASLFARSLSERKNLLKLLSMNHYDLEENSSIQKLVEFKRSFKKSLEAVDSCLEKFFAKMSAEKRQDFIYSFFPFMFGIYPYTFVTQKQREAMDKAGVKFKQLTIYEIIYAQVKQLLSEE